MLNLQKRKRYSRACARFHIELQKGKHPIGNSNLNHWKQILKIFRENQNK